MEAAALGETGFAAGTADRPQSTGARNGSLARGFGLLAVLLTANVLNYADRSILSVLAEELKKDLQVTDTQLGVLYGTSFAVVSAILCFGMARLVDVWIRTRLITIGVLMWSALTALSGFVRNYGQLAAARFGIGVGEAAISPVSFSILSEIFPVRLRGFVFGLYMSGPFLGSALCLTAGGWFVAHWSDHCGTFGACSLKGWQAAFLAFGAPGILVAAIVALVREPGSAEELERRRSSRPLKEALGEIGGIVPPFSFVRFARLGGLPALRTNLLLFAGVCLLCAALVATTGNYLQWVGAGFAIYAILAWNHALLFTDPPLARLVVRSSTFVSTILGGGMNSTISTAVIFWSVPLAIRRFEVSAFEAGSWLALAMTIGGVGGTICGGIVNDVWKGSRRSAPLWICIAAVLGAAVALCGMLLAGELKLYAVALTVEMFFLFLWPAASSALGQELVLPSMRGRTSASMSNTSMVVGMCIGPYLVGRVADATGSVETGLLALLACVPVAVLFYAIAIRRLDEALLARERVAASQSI